MNIQGIRKKHLLNYITIPKYKTLLIDKVLKDKLKERNARPISFSNQAKYTTCIIVLDNFCMSK